MIRDFSDVHTILKQFVPPARSMRGNYTLDKITKLMEALGNPQESYKVIHVAGTSGKTSTCYYVAALLGQTGKKIGMSVSPHVDEVNERLQINLTPLPEKQYCQALGEFLMVIEKTDIKPTYFELLVAFAYWEFARQKVDYAVVEVGLGGLLDGTNVVNRSDKVCVITDIGLDHTNVLGTDTAAIAAQKAGIIQKDNIVFSYAQPDKVMDVLRRSSDKKQAKLYEIEPQTTKVVADLPLFQQRNWQLAKAITDYVVERDGPPALTTDQLKISTKTLIPARMEIIKTGGKTLILDGSHNDQKMKVLVGSIEASFPGQKAALLISLVAGRNRPLKKAFKQLSKIASSVILTSFSMEQDLHQSPINPGKLADVCAGLGFEKIKVIQNPVMAYKELLKQPEPLLLVTGSFYLLNHIRPLVFNKVFSEK